MADIQFDRGHVNAQEAAAGRFGGGEIARPVEGEEGEFGFEDFLDIINPLQHIPVVSTLYREITGDEISAPARIFGGTLYGGPSGFVSAVANALFDEVAGDDVGASVLALFGGDDDSDPQLADEVLPAAATEAMTATPLETAVGTATTSPAATANMAPPGGLPAGLIPAALAPTAPAPTAPAPAAPPGSALEPPIAPGMLTGQDALNALFNDLRGRAPAEPAGSSPSAAQQQTVVPAMPPPPKSAPRFGSAGKSPSDDEASKGGASDGRADDRVVAGDAAANPLILAAQSPDAALADQMLMALDKYRAMTEKRHQEQARQRAEGATDPLPLPGVP